MFLKNSIKFDNTIVILIAFLVNSICCRVSLRSTSGRPNIVFILADDLGWNDISFHGSTQIITPNIDALAYSGLILQNYYVTPLCTPSRSALMTGKHPIHTGMQHDVIYGDQRYGLPLSESILPNHLKSLGYKNHIIGKWHLGHFKRVHTPLFRGFDSHYGYWTGHQDYFDHTAVESDSWGYDMRRNFEVDRSAFGNYTTRLLSDEAVTVISNHDVSSPLFLYVAHLAVHSANPYSPLQAPRETVDLFPEIQDIQRRRFAAMVHEMDLSVGKLVKALADKDMLENTVIVFSSDNGGPAAGFNSNAASNWPLKGVKNTPWEGGVRAAGFVWSPLIPSARRGQIMDSLMDISDWLPTLYEAAGASPLDLKSLDGKSHWKTIMFNMPSVRDHVLHNIDDDWGYAAIRKYNYKLVKGTTYNGSWDNWYGPSGRDTNNRNEPQSLYRSLEYANKVLDSDVGKCLTQHGMTTFTRRNLVKRRHQAEVICGEKPSSANPCYPLQSPCLFDISKDPCEYNNLASLEPRVVTDLLELLEWYNSTAVKPLNTPSDPLSNPKYWDYTFTNWVDFL